MGRKLFAGLVVWVIAVMLALPVRADTAQDQQLLAALKAAGWSIPNPSQAILEAQMVCGEGLDHHVPVQEMRSTLVSRFGHSVLDATTLIKTAVSVYCPKYSGAIAGIDPGKPASGPTKADGAEFTKDVYDYGILLNHYPNEIAAILEDICFKDREFPKSGLPKSYIVSLYMEGYGLSKKDANWLVNTALDKCN